MKRPFVLFLTLVYSFLLSAQSYQALLPGGSAMSVGTYSSQFINLINVRANQAALAGIAGTAASVFTEKRFLLNALGTVAFSFVLPTHSGTFGASLQYFGNNLYSDRLAGLAYGRTLGKKAAIGMQADYVSTRIRDYGSVAALTFEAGLLFHLTDQLHAGIHTFNPLRQQLNKSAGMNMPSIYSAGMGYEYSSKFFVGAELRQEEDPAAVRFSVGAEYRLIEQLALQVGLANEPAANYLGMRVRWGQLQLHLAGTYHPQLGMTPAVAISFQAHEKNAVE